jgi:hypothetical protein
MIASTNSESEAERADGDIVLEAIRLWRNEIHFASRKQQPWPCFED